MKIYQNYQTLLSWTVRRTTASDPTAPSAEFVEIPNKPGWVRWAVFRCFGLGFVSGSRLFLSVSVALGPVGQMRYFDAPLQ